MIDTRMAEFLRRRQRAGARLERVNKLLARWDSWEELQALPADERPESARPPLTRDILNGRKVLLLELADELEQLWMRRN